MIKKTITYEDFNGEKQTEDLYFNLTKAEAIELEVSFEGGLSAHLGKYKNDPAKIVEMIKTVLLKAYGVKSQDGKKFIKSKEVMESFVSSEAYSEIFMMMLDPDKASELINGIIPRNIESNNTNI